MRKVRNAAAVVALALAVVLGVAPHASSAPPYSNYSLVGTYHVSFSGLSVTTGRLEAGLGIYTFDGTGNMTGSEVFNARGVLCNVTLAGTYSIGQNGAGILNVTYTGSTPACTGSYTSSLLFFDDVNVIRAVSNSPDFITVTEEWRKQLQ